MKHKGFNKLYFGIGIREAYDKLNAVEIFFYLFKLKRRAPEGECYKRGRDYVGFNLRKSFRTVFNWSIEL